MDGCKNIFIVLLFMSAVAMVPDYCFAQGNVYLGITPGVNFVKYNTSPFSIPNSDPNTIIQNGAGTAPLLGVSCQVNVGNPINNNFIVFEGFYDSKLAKFANISNANNEIAASLSYVLLNIGYKYNFNDGPMVNGPAIELSAYMGYKLIGNFTYTANNISPPIDGAKTWRFGLRGQFVYDIPISPLWVVSPLVGFDYPFTKVDNTSRSWMASSVYIGISFLIAIEDLTPSLICQ